MKSYRIRGITTLALAAAALLVAQPASAQQPQGGGLPMSVPDSVQDMLQEFQALQQRVGQAQDSALKANPQLVDAQADLQAFVRETMVEVRPSLQQDMERLEELQQEAMAAQQAQDTTELREIAMEGQRLQRELEEAQAAAMEQEEVQVRVERFETRMVEAMEDVDEGVAEALERMETLAAKLQAYQESQGG